SDGVRLMAEEAGRADGPPVLLICGTTMARVMWAPTVAGLSDRYRVITFDTRDVGESERVSKQYDSARLADDAIAVLDAFAVRRVHAAGFSLGGCVVQQLGLRHPDRVVSLAAASCWSRPDAHLRREFQFWLDLVEKAGWELQFKMMSFMSFS